MLRQVNKVVIKDKYNGDNLSEQQPTTLVKMDTWSFLRRLRSLTSSPASVIGVAYDVKLSASLFYTICLIPDLNTI